MKSLSNPFRIQGVVEPPFFTDRADEIARVRRALLEVPGRLLVYGERRMGKTSLLHVARRAAKRAGGRVVFADLSTASSPADMANRVLESATRALGRNWTDIAGEFVRRLRVRLQLVPDPVSGLAIPTVEAGLRSRDEDEQHGSLIGVLDTLDSMAADRDATLGIVLDEFQEIHRFGGEAAEWRLRGAIQHHQHVSYVLAGSDTSLIRAMTGRARAFYGMFEMLSLGAIDDEHLARWIDERLAAVNAPAPGIGARCIAVAGPRTRDVVRLARAAYEVLRADPGEAEGVVDLVAAVRAALERVVAEEDDPMRTLWANLTSLQQNVLRAVAWNGAGLAARETVERFGLGYGGTARNSALALIERGVMERRKESASGYGFDSPFVRAWVVTKALPDAGILVEIDHA